MFPDFAYLVASPAVPEHPRAARFFRDGRRVLLLGRGRTRADVLIRQMRQYGAKVATAVALLSLASADAASAVTSFFKAPMSRQTFVDFSPLRTS